MAVRAQARGGSTPYNFVVGPTGNYPATLAGVQAAINAADAAKVNTQFYTVFFEPTTGIALGDNTPVNVPDGAIFVGSVNEMLPTALQLTENGTFLFDNTSDATTVLDINFNFTGTNDSYKFYNIFYYPQVTLKAIPVTTSERRIYFYQSTMLSEAVAVAISNDGTVPTGNGVLHLYADDSYISADENGGKFISINTTGIDTGSQTIEINASNNSIIGQFPGVASTLIGPNINLKINSSCDSVIAVPFIFSGDTSGSSIRLNLLDTQVIIAAGLPFINAAGIEDFAISQQDVIYYSSTSPSPSTDQSIYQNLGDYTFGFTTTNNPSQNITLMGCKWSNDAGTVDSFNQNTVSCPATASAQSSANSINWPANTYIDDIIVKNTTSNATILKFGSTIGGTDIIAALTIPANATVFGSSVGFGTRWWPASGNIYYDTTTLWNGAVVNILIPRQSNIK